MNEKVFKVNISTIIDAKDEYRLHNNNIYDSLKRILVEIEKIDEIYNTGTALEYQDKLTKFLNMTIESVYNDNNYFDRLFDDIISSYIDLHNNISDSVAKDNNNEV